MEERTEIIRTRPDHEHDAATVDYHPPAAHVDQVEAVAYDPYAERRNIAEKLVQAIWLVFGLIEALILIRFTLRALGANPAAPFAQLIYGITAPFVAPFVGLFPTPQADGYVLEPHALVALVVYALLAWLLARIVWLVVGDTRSTVASKTREVRTRTH